MSREIYVAAREGGTDPDTNQRLRLAINKAKAANVPNDNIERTLKKASGETSSTSYEEVTYEGYGPAGVAVLVEVLTDNRNRTAAEIRHIFSKFGGNLGETGCVAWMFSRRGSLIVDREQSNIDEDGVMMQAIEAGAEDFVADADSYTITTSVEDFETVKEKLEEEGLAFTTAEMTMVPQNTVQLTGDDALKMLKLMETLDDNDDVQNVYANFEIDETELKDR